MEAVASLTAEDSKKMTEKWMNLILFKPPPPEEKDKDKDE